MRAKAWMLLLAILAALAPTPAYADVRISFYSKELGASFPHAFVLLSGEVEETGEKIHANYGFTATHISPAILMGAVKGEIISMDEAYVRKSDEHFSISLSDDEYRRVMATVEQWRSLKQPSYDLNRQNCVYFVAYVAATLGMKADTPKKLMKKPRSYLQYVRDLNRSWLEARGAKLALAKS